jgi:mannan endo-1,4-beta-mannosidase
MTRGIWAALLAATVAWAAEPPAADPQASAAVKAELAYIRHLGDGNSRRVLSGQFVGFGPESSEALADEIGRQTGKWPAFIGVDYIDFKAGRIDSTVANRTALAYWRKGGWVEVNVHMPNPLSKSGVGLRDHGIDLAPMSRPGTPANAAWIREMDAMADGLEALQREGVVVLWRPFHEMNGGWFWWGAKPKADFVALWRMMFEHFTRVRGLHNLIWVYSPSAGATAADYYPGDGCVDLVGVDAYTDYIDPAHIRGLDALAKLDKPSGFGEFGPHGASNPKGDFDYTRFASGIAGSFPQAVFFMSWNEKWSPAHNPKAREFYNDPMIVTRADLPAGPR